MPVRKVDGEAIWGSKKLRQVPEEFRYHYPLMLPLAEYNGTFELDVEVIWGKVYSVLFPSVTKEIVARVLDSFTKAGLLLVWNLDNKTYGYFVGMEKKGRLPSPSEQKKYNKVLPDPPLIQGSSEEAPRTPLEESCVGLGLGLGLGLGCGWGLGEEMALSDKIRNIFEEKQHKVIQVPEWALKRFRSGMGGEKEQLARLRDFLDANPGGTLYEYLEVDDELAESKLTAVVARGLIQNDDVANLATKIYEITDLPVAKRSLEAAQSLLERYPSEDILNAFRYFYSKLNDKFYVNNSVRDFFENGAGESVIRAMYAQRQKDEELAKLLSKIPAVAVEMPQDEDEVIPEGKGLLD